MKEDKLDRYKAYEHELGEQGITYAPATFTAYGRRHPDVTRMLDIAATKVARHQGLSSGGGLARSWKRNLCAELWRRAARMIRACIPSDGQA